MELLDFNDNAPQFQFFPHNVTVSEGIPISSTVFTVSAADPDSDSSVQYFLTPDG